MTELQNLTAALPELILAIGAMALLMIGVFTKDKEAAFDRVALISILLLAVVGFITINEGAAEKTLAFNNLFITDSFAIFTKTVMLVGSLIAILMSGPFLKDMGIKRFEYPVLIVLATLGMFLMVSSNNFLTLYVGLELQSLALYVLAAINRDRQRSTEAGLKYFVLGALSSGMLLYGISFIYGFAGSTDFDTVALASKEAGTNIGLIVGLVFLLAGLAFKVSAVPFHMWTPDVYEGAPTPVTAFFAAAPKVAALALFVRAMYGAFPDASTQWSQVVIFISVASMLVGAFVALMQSNIKRLMAYSSIGHAGYALVGLAAGAAAGGIQALLIYGAIYTTMTLGAFAVILTMRRGGKMVESIDDLAGLSKNNLPMAVALAIFMFSLAGIPGLAGFFGKWEVILAAVNANLITVAVIAVLTSVVSAYYYLRIIKVMFFDDAAEPFDATQSSALSAVIGVTAVVNSPVSFVLIGSLASAAAWAAGVFS
ncbi:NADH-quinone oxidoreductase subunit NuoN [Temperatibacter marinus]|uniref:NADH-quinone oxidoreductase subunit N n=1 Tax=Temperatibacter marinus TaxID=1456591 RepID=A0AA52EFY3_9PROT|nr:NADH-quinone oxidoreductase subunit NuoN [Temperatibacter marinus]WND02403.1 NADH-quinone oxidoreductase subunit NuoN [Temperatibacter marinus]